MGEGGKEGAKGVSSAMEAGTMFEDERCVDAGSDKDAGSGFVGTGESDVARFEVSAEIDRQGTEGDRSPYRGENTVHVCEGRSDM